MEKGIREEHRQSPHHRKIDDAYTTIEVSHGQHEIEVETNRTGDTIWVAFCDEVSFPVCLSEADKVGICRTPSGFILYADIGSVSRIIKWHIE